MITFFFILLPIVKASSIGQNTIYMLNAMPEDSRTLVLTDV